MEIHVYHHNTDNTPNGEKDKDQDKNITALIGKLLNRQIIFEERFFSYVAEMTQTMSHTRDLIIINNQKQEQIMKTLTEVLTEVQSEKTLIDGVGTLISGLRQQVADATAGKLNPADQALLDSIFDAADQNKAALSAAAATGTPAAGVAGTGTENGGTVASPALPAPDESKLPG